MPRTKAKKAVKLPPFPVMASVKVTWKCTCGYAQETVGPSIGASGGGCSCTQDSDSYCYCPNPEAYIRVDCAYCKKSHEFSF